MLPLLKYLQFNYKLLLSIFSIGPVAGVGFQIELINVRYSHDSI